MVALYSSISTERFGVFEKRCQARAGGASQTPADGPSNQDR